MTHPFVVTPFHPTSRDSGPSIADAKQSLRHIFVRDMVQTCSIGVYDHEHEHPQRVRFNIDLGVREDTPTRDSLDAVVCYEQIVNRVRAIARDGHTNLIETMAERVASVCLQDSRVLSARVRVEKLDVFDDIASVGVEIERTSQQTIP